MRVCGVRDLDGKFACMLAVKQACEEARIPYPPELKAYFGHPREDERILRQEMEEIDIPKDRIREYSRDTTDYVDIDLTGLSPKVKSLRISHSY